MSHDTFVYAGFMALAQSLSCISSLSSKRQQCFCLQPRVSASSRIYYIAQQRLLLKKKRRELSYVVVYFFQRQPALMLLLTPVSESAWQKKERTAIKNSQVSSPSLFHLSLSLRISPSDIAKQLQCLSFSLFLPLSLSLSLSRCLSL